MPERGPNHTSITKKIAQMILGRLLETERRSLAGKLTQPGFRFLAARREIGREINIPKTVETKAILIVSTKPIHAVEHVKSKRG